MQTTWAGRLRCQVFLPDKSEVKFEKRGFWAPDPARQANLEKVGTKFLEGFAYGMGGRSLPDIESSLEMVEPTFRGFAYEGCSMALAVRDGIAPPFNRHWVRDLLASRGDAHIYMAYVGVGWAMARLPRVRWRAIEPRDRLLRWLVMDGYGFHQAYFRTRKYVDGQYQAPIPGWRSDYANQAVDQGIGRALWFIHGGRPLDVAAAVRRFAEPRQVDLWSGVGLAATMAGGCDPEGLAELYQTADSYRPELGLGAVFAAKARHYAGFVPEHTVAAASAFGGLTIEEAVSIADNGSAIGDVEGDQPSYEIWRRRIRAELDTTARSITA